MAENNKRIFRLKAMVIARLLAEITALSILAVLPLIIFFSGHWQAVSIHTKIITIIAAVLATAAIPAYGFITFEATTDENGISTRSLFKKQSALWSAVTGLKLRTSWGWRRYVVSSKNGDLTFPVWFGALRDLTEIIRSQLPGRGMTVITAGGAGSKTYSQDFVNIALQLGNIAISLVFIGVFWMFFANMQSNVGRRGDPTDLLIILGACVLLTLAMVLRCVMILLTPVTVTVDGSGLKLKTLLFQKQIGWPEILRIAPPVFFLPPGIFMTTKKGWFLLGEQLEAFDELQEDLISKAPHIPPRPKEKK